jgi:hypothetical protein
MQVNPAVALCPGPSVSSVILDWRLRGGTGGQLAMSKVQDIYSAVIPAQPDGSIRA